MTNVIVIEGKTDAELIDIQTNFLNQKLTIYNTEYEQGNILSRNDILDIFQKEAPVLDIDEGKHMIRRGEGEESMILDIVGKYYSIEHIEEFKDALVHILDLDNNPDSQFYKKEKIVKSKQD